MLCLAPQNQKRSCGRHFVGLIRMLLVIWMSMSAKICRLARWSDHCCEVFRKQNEDCPSKLRCAYLGWGLEEASLIDLASRHELIWTCCHDRKLQGWYADAPKRIPRKKHKNIVWVVPRTRMVASPFQTFKASLDEWEARQRDPPTHLRDSAGQVHTNHPLEQQFTHGQLVYTAYCQCQDFTHARWVSIAATVASID